MAHDVFISYSSKDKPSADAVCALLEARGIRCWIAPRDVQPGQIWGEAIVDAIEGARAMVLLFSSSVNESGHIPKEVERAFGKGVTVIPLRIENVRPAKSLDYFLSNVHWLDALDPPLERHVDELAATIQRILPGRPGIAPPAPPAEPVAPARPPAEPGPPARKSRRLSGWLVLAGVVAFLAVASVAGWFFLRGSEDPIVGCWQWFTNNPVTIRGDGSMIAGPFIGRWRALDNEHARYTFTWPEPADTTVLSADGLRLSGSNQYGVAMSANRLTRGPGIAGTWRWYNTAIVVIRPDGTISTGPLAGRWRASGGSGYVLTWPKPVDNVTLSPDHQSVQGMNQYGIAVSGTRGGTCAN